MTLSHKIKTIGILAELVLSWTLILLENLEGFSSILKYQCKMCNYVTKIRTDPSTSSTSINQAAVIGALAGGGGYATLSEFAAATNVPCMSQSAYIRYENEIGGYIVDVALQSLVDAGAEERELAIRAGSIDGNGVPLATVQCDGMWGTRTHKNEYNSRSGVVSSCSNMSDVACLVRFDCMYVKAVPIGNSCQNLRTNA